LARVELRGVSKVYPGGVEAVRAIDLAIDDDELFVIVGPSGSGKSTLLRLVAGLETPNAGEVWIGDRRVDPIPPRDRDVAMVFQTPALYPHLTVRDNLAFGLRARGRPRAEIAARVASAAERLGLVDVLGRRPSALSGGQRQRVALGRAIVRQPRVFLLDEPFSSLDAPLRAAMRAELVDLHRRLGTTMIHVTHDQAEAMAIGGRIAVMDRGRIVQEGPPLDVYDRPASRFVAGFLGSPPMNLLRCLLERADGGMRLRVEGADAWTIPAGPTWTAPLERRGEGRIDLGIRPEHVHVSRRDGPLATDGLVATAEVRRLEPLGHETIVTLALGPHPLSLRLPARARPVLGERLTIRLDPDRIAWFDAETGVAFRPEPTP
jgi:multiple sugar transport system ATP-binding protein